MKIRAITLDNVRRFTDPVRVGPIGDGITLLCQPNESGKSTLFDALHALFFVKYSGWPAEVSSLQPHSGGKVAVTVELEVEGAQWRVRKQWQRGAGGEARAWCDGQLRHQGDDVEHWLSGLVRGEGAGPSGLLWVRQGRVSLSVDGAYGKQDSKGDEHEQRRSLLTLVTGAMDDITGGKTMDGALDTCRAELAALQTATGKAKAGGRWAEAQARMQDLESRETRLAAQADALHAALTERRRLATQLAELTDPVVEARRKAELADAEAALKEAERHAELVAQARAEAALARQTHDAARDAANAAQALRAEAGQAITLLAEATAHAEQAEARLAQAEAAFAATHAGRDAAERAEAQARDVARRAARRDAARAAVDRRSRIEDALKRAEAADAEASHARAEAGRGPAPKDVARIEDLARALDTARAMRDRAGPILGITYLPGASPVLLDGAPLPDGAAQAITGQAVLDLPGIGRMTITPKEDDTGAALRAAQGALAAALAESGRDDLASLRAAAQARADALKAADLAEQRRDTLAPDGLQALRNELALLPAPEAVTDEALPETQAAEAAVEQAVEALSAARTAEAEARARRDTHRDAATEARALERAATERRARAQQALAGLADIDEAAQARTLDALRAAADEAQALHAQRAREAPDATAAQARVMRLRQVRDNARNEAQTGRERMAELRVLIQTQAEEGVEEALADTRLRLDSARDGLERVVFELDVLRRLTAALEEAQTAARDRYYAPIAQELRPLLEQLWDDAELVWSDDTLLPSKMIRRGETEPIDTLSGGTQEQIAFLVRLAFARLLAKAGRHAPLILDDALVYSDDDRIERLFNALHGAAGDLQIIVLSCRQRAFRELGAPQVGFVPVSGTDD